MKPKRVTIKVSQADINHGARAQCDSCPIARAAQRAGIRYPAVGMAQLFQCSVSGLQPGVKILRRVELPIKAQRFVTAFDRRRPVKPFQFTVTLE